MNKKLMILTMFLRLSSQVLPVVFDENRVNMTFHRDGFGYDSPTLKAKYNLGKLQETSFLQLPAEVQLYALGHHYTGGDTAIKRSYHLKEFKYELQDLCVGLVARSMPEGFSSISKVQDKKDEIVCNLNVIKFLKDYEKLTPRERIKLIELATPDYQQCLKQGYLSN